MQEQTFVAPEKPLRPRNLWRKPYDFLYAILVVWGSQDLARVMRLLHASVTLLKPADNLCDTRYFEGMWVPVLLPTPQFTPHTEAFLRLAEAATAFPENADIRASMRLVALLAVTQDYRARMVAMVDHPGIHGVLGSRPPAEFDFWEFLRLGGGRRLHDYALLFKEYLDGGRVPRVRIEEEVVKMTHAFAEEIAAWWVELYPPGVGMVVGAREVVNDERLRLSPSDDDDEDDKQWYRRSIQELFGHKPWKAEEDEPFFTNRCICRINDAIMVAEPCEHLCLCVSCYADFRKASAVFLERCPKCAVKTTRVKNLLED